jgi:hypothetical protein
MNVLRLGKRVSASLVGLFLFFGLIGSASPQGPCGERPICTVADLKKLSPCQLWDLFLQGDLAALPKGRLDGAVLHLADKRFSRFRVWGFNLVWRGKSIGEDTSFVNRWVGDRDWLGSCYVIGSSWADGKPAILIEYPLGTPLFANMHDEMRQVAPGLYLGIIYDRCPCPRFRGFFAMESQRCCPPESR